VVDNHRNSADVIRPRPSGWLLQVLFLLLLFARGILLWIVVPLSAVWWLLTMPVRQVRRKAHVSLAQTIGWADLNLIAALTLGRAARFVGWSRASEVQHRVSWIDPA